MTRRGPTPMRAISRELDVPKTSVRDIIQRERGNT